MQQPIRVYIVHNHQLFSDVVTMLLNQEDEIVLIDAAACNLDGMALDSSAAPFDVVLVDTTMARMQAVQATWEIKRAFPTVQVIVLGVEYHDEAMVGRVPVACG